MLLRAYVPHASTKYHDSFFDATVSPRHFSLDVLRHYRRDVRAHYALQLSTMPATDQVNESYQLKYAWPRRFRVGLQQSYNHVSAAISALLIT